MPKTLYKDDIKFFVPLDMAEISKSLSGDEHGNYVRGWASTPDLDQQGDIIDPQGIDISELLNHGYVNYEHDSTKIVGHPTDNSYVDLQNGLYVETKLDMTSPYAQEMWAKATHIAKTGVDRPLGYSVEGRVLRDDKDPSIIRKAVITGLALTVNPANSNATWETLVKSMTTGYGISPESRESAGVLRVQQTAKNLHNLAQSIKGFSVEDFKSVAKSLDAEGRYSNDIAVMLLQLGYGLSRDTAMKQLTNHEGD